MDNIERPQPERRGATLRPTGLQPAHRGYNYQDLVTAYLLVLGLLGERPTITIDRKTSGNDRFDDISLRSEQRFIRRQIKHSSDPNRTLSTDDFVRPNSTLYFGALVGTFAADNPPADEYRLCATWESVDAELRSVLTPVAANPTVLGSSSRLFCLELESIEETGAQDAFFVAVNQSGWTDEQVRAFCGRFVIELGMPTASFDLGNPGALELALVDLLANRVGIGDYPNQGRDPSDVAAVAIRLASLARAAGDTLSPDDVEGALGIRKDFGYVPQQFPIRWDRFCDRVKSMERVRDLVGNTTVVIVEGSPGIGKSWLLTKLCADLEQSDVLVARHYCYLEPGDPLVGRRITVDVLLGNLLEELTRKAPHLLESLPRRYSATQESLEAALGDAAAAGTKVCLVVDGLDHVVRVRADSPTLSVEDTSVVEQLCALTIPEGCTLVLGSQPGPHLDAIRALSTTCKTIEVPSWSDAELRDQLSHLDLVPDLGRQGLDVEATVDAFVTAANGSPLYAHSLAIDLAHRLQLGEITDPVAWLRAIPPIHGQISNYYQYLFSSLDELPQQFAKVLGAIDFAVSAADLREMFPAPFKGKVDKALARLAPVLASASAQGGYRVYHESFRRFINEWIRSHDESIADTLSPVIDWLVKRGIYSDALAYRFLFPTLFRASRFEDIERYTPTDFVSTSLAHGHPKQPILNNLILAAHSAARRLNWGKLARYIELHRSVYECFEYKLTDPGTYWDTYSILFGHKALLQRLLFDGRPTCKAEVGLQLCAKLDAHGTSAPWKEYLELHDEVEMDDDENQHVDQYEPMVHGLAISQRETLNIVLGRIRTIGAAKISKRLFRAIRSDTWRPSMRLRVAVLRLVAANLSPAEVQKLSLGQWIEELTPDWQAAVRLAAASCYDGPESVTVRANLAERAAAKLADPRLLLECLQLGAPMKIVRGRLPALDLSSLSLGKHSPERDDVEAWYFQVRIAAAANPGEIQALLTQTAGQGWYLCWIRYVLMMACAEQAIATGSPRDLLRAFSELVRDTAPFAGNPRACDLYAIRGVIASSLLWGLSLLRTADEWRWAISYVQQAMEGTNTSLQRSISGPILPDVLLPELLPYAHVPEARDAVIEFGSAAIRERDEHGTYLESHAELRMSHAQALTVCGRNDEAMAIWSDICVMLCGYGHRKDSTIYELLEAPISSVFPERDAAIHALSSLQPLAEAMWTHTDGRSTRGAPNAWFRRVIALDLALAASMLARATHEVDGGLGWTIEEALEDVARAAASTAEPHIACSLFATLMFDPDSSHEADERLAAEETAIRRLAATNAAAAFERCVQLSAQVDGDGRHRAGNLAERIAKIASVSPGSVPLPAYRGTTDDAEDARTRSTHLIERDLPEQHPEPWFDATVTRLSVVTGVRRAFVRTERHKSWAGFCEAFGYRLIYLAESGESPDSLEELISFCADRLRATFIDEPLLEQLAAGLERHELPSLAARAYALAYTRSRGHGGWSSIGDESRSACLHKAIGLDRGGTLRLLGDDIVRLLEISDLTTFVTGATIARLAEIGDLAEASESWWEAFRVIKHRLPLVTDQTAWLLPLSQIKSTEWSTEEAIAAIVLSRIDHPLMTVKLAALLELHNLLRSSSRTLVAPLRWFLTENSTTTSLVAVLGVLVEGSEYAEELVSALSSELVLLTQGGIWGVGYSASELLRKVDSAQLPTEQSRCVSSYLPANGVPEIEEITADDPRFETLEDFFPDLKAAVAWRFRQILGNSDRQKSIARRRYELAFDRSDRGAAPARVLMWHTELWEQALHDVLPEMIRALDLKDRWSQEHENQLAEILIPNIRGYVAAQRARSPRPNVELPASLSPGPSRTFILRAGDEDPRYTGWYRIAYFEVQRTRRSLGGSIEPGAIAFAGVVSEPRYDPFPLGQIPLARATLHEWFERVSEADSRFRGFTAADAQFDSCFGRHTLLVPTLAFRSAVCLSNGAKDAALRVAAGEKDAVVLRTWRIRDPKSYSVNRDWLFGCDLLISPETFFRLDLMSYGLSEIQLVLPIEGGEPEE